MAWQGSPLELKRMNHLLQQSRASGVYCRWLATLQRSHKISTAATACTPQKDEKDPMEKLQKNPYFEKYKGKIHDLQQNSPEEFESRLEEFKKKGQPKEKKVEPKAKKQPVSAAASKMSQTSKLSQLKMTKEKTLNDIMKVDLLYDKSAQEIKQIWQQHFSKKKNTVFAVIPVKTYEVIHERSSTYPMFLYTLPRGDGYEFYVASFSGHECYFTPLIAYQAHQADSPVCLTLHHYSELGDEKGIVLMHGEYNSDILNAQDAQLLCQQVQIYYGPESTSYHLVETFNEQPDNFTDLISQLEKLTDNNEDGLNPVMGSVAALVTSIMKSSIKYKVVAAVDINDVANEVYKYNFQDINLLQRSIESISLKELNKLSPTMLLMSPPCQPFTRVGLQKDIEDARTNSFIYLLETLPKLEKLPNYILIENVKGFECSQTRDKMVSTLRECGYNFQEFLLTPLQFGVPNSRMRYYMVAKKKPLTFVFDTCEGKKLQKNPYFEKYKGKIHDLQQNSPEEFESRLEEFKKKGQPKEKKVEPKAKKQPVSAAASKMSQTSKLSQLKMTEEKTLNDIMKVDLLYDKSAQEIKQIWQQHFSKKESTVFAVIPVKIYEVIHERSSTYPMFLYTLPRGDGYEFYVASFSGHECYFTPLIAYQAHQADAPVCLTLHHYSELGDEKGIVLMHGEYNRDILNAQDAQLLCQQVQIYYGPESTSYHLVETFNEQPDNFKHTDLISQLEKVLPLR
ncbi:uncharacterized protein LOC106175034 [Lingula anatina]|uniref:Uncharacterized protein LOC106175034 n=1 Tax=Lingula anatina TaxID=7574 RepID=A0A1S3JPK3_LINAN|nr:uncharacterized protein LOC106175034 [Lingula anatina]|eukprot:XP_013412300.1 uncharacterized protein LOC106175034 [Lingula anatina]